MAATEAEKKEDNESKSLGGEKVVGWRDGIALTSHDVSEILRRESLARQEYRAVRKAVERKKQKKVEDPLAGMPPAWQAFWSTVPHLDAKTAYKRHQEKLKRHAEQANQEKPPASKRMKRDDDETEEEVLKQVHELEASVRSQKDLLAKEKNLCLEWDRKLSRLARSAKEDAERTKNAKRNLENASYTHGMTEGKLRSSNTYFTFLELDIRKNHQVKKHNLTRSCSLMESEMSDLLLEVKDLLSQLSEANERERAAAGVDGEDDEDGDGGAGSDSAD
eukprot:gnl/TRDRNA2_/TRDRNA2_42625_c0_seq1.p1 gnl/TRDRNA2_/TRDRNA2_42625_c0~~gnl/TRDRNA2_/TRDRNA2_42625_c0_seq1.p1  ORF type:complete len:294 (-),score=68.98 gnl/TRDRNA2_/TRDRNA2_42625_c0_seq1:32-862(-)